MLAAQSTEALSIEGTAQHRLQIMI